MKTDDLIRALASDTHPRSIRPARLLAFVLPLAVAIAVAVFLLAIGPREDLVAALQTVRFDFKLVVAAILAASALAMVARIARPDADWSRGIVLVIAPAILLAGVALELVMLEPGRWAPAAMGTNALVCLTFIPLIGLGPLALFVVFLRNGATVKPVLAGALAGLAAGGLAAVLYALHCTDDSPLFVAIWYSIAIAILAALGAVAGRLAVRW